MPCFPTFPGGPFSHEYTDPRSSDFQPGYTRRAMANRVSHFVEVTAAASVAASVDCWAHIGQSVPIQARTTRIQFVVRPVVSFSVEASSWVGGYASAEALAHLVVWNSSGIEVGHSVFSLYRAIAVVWGWPRSGNATAPVTLVLSIDRPRSAALETWHVAFGLQAWAGSGGLAAASANAHCTLGSMCANES